MRPTSCLTGAWRCEVPITAAPSEARRASCSGRMRDGPEPKRPSAGFSSSGIFRSVSDPVMRLLGIVGIYMPRRAAVDAVASRWSSPPVKRQSRRQAPSVARSLLLKLRVDPVHLGAQLLAHDLDLVARLLLAHALEVLLAGTVLGDPLAGEVARLDLAQQLLHRRPRLRADHALAAR